ncbi:alpha-ketoacid dehydrogenase subunit beta [Kocuria palustris]|uniref:alpha-ketoacid dehydrogenase subunit beta n=1 Tax=Kocuria palustris TaxID=71999 RepID=UPI0011A07186|nr:transketolase C-terminal domain-containing protein [Kocuria palustris]
MTETAQQTTGAEQQEQPAAPAPRPKALTFGGALNAALAHALEDTREVVIFGEDVGTLGGVFRVTDGLAAAYGPERCFDTPLAESGIVGTAVGMAMNGLRPVVEMQFDAFAYPAFEQVASHLAKQRNRTRGCVSMPVTVRIPYGGGVGGVEHHCDSSEGYYAHTPGLKVYTPGTVEDAYLMLREAIDSDDPVIFFEPKKLYWAKSELTADELRSRYEAERIREGRAAVIREGEDLTLVTYGPSLPTALEAAEAAAEDGTSIEVVDLRTIVPLDDETIRASVERTGRALVVAEAQGFASVASELAARIQEQCFHSLASPVLRVTGFDIPYAAPKLEKHHLPSVDRILDAVDDLQWED